MVKHFTLCLAMIACLIATQIAAADPLSVDYHGWHIDLSRDHDQNADQKVIKAVEHQLDMVDHVGLRADILQFMRSIKISTNTFSPHYGTGRYSRLSGVEVRGEFLDPSHPTVLHELLHVLHERALTDGFHNHDIERFFQHGRTLWPAGSYMLRNEKEFFAVTASVYLFGSDNRPPFTRSQLRMRQPLYYQWLANLFDNGRPRS